ncbi:GTP 3',8-cyclase MoaA [Sphingomonas kyeonggiensis]|uniref:GTP 3',8-cyclase n=1 Tax=Sphingomonas kyeonggiensis TaxID=1268553 RepID=A0A7W6JPS0_9SPHN|nr:GTP 3',8-cyclase MoaA [Sphingomonas kyeonggiensis]MBB4097317.1 cyclic pyranopterin phosphate synthase [Sphingomonas kyeonggiensis]
MAAAPALIDAHGRAIQYLRISVTDRCDLRCRYCMSENMRFLPRNELLSLDELALVADRFVARGVRKIRLTGGEPLVRSDTLDLVRRIGSHLGGGLDEVTLTTNGTRLAEHAGALADAGVRRVNVSIDSRDPATFRHITRYGDVAKVLAGIDAAQAAGLAVKLNMVALKGLNEDEIAPMLAWATERGLDLTLIETMPLGEIDEDRTDRFLPLTGVLADLRARFELLPDTHRTGGPARYWRVAGSTTRLGLITPLSANFCDGCNRVRLATDGKLYMCLGHDEGVDLKAALRDHGPTGLDDAIDGALRRKPARHDFRIAAGAAPATRRHMSVTGG